MVGKVETVFLYSFDYKFMKKIGNIKDESVLKTYEVKH